MPRSLSKGGIAGVVVGVVIGVLLLVLIFLLVLPFLPCVRRRWQREGDLAATESGLGPRSHSFLSATQIGDTIRRLSQSVPRRPTELVSGAGSDTGDSAEKPVQHVYSTTSAPSKYGLSSPLDASLDETPWPGSPPGISVEPGRTTTPSLSWGPDRTQPGLGPMAPSREGTLMEDSERAATGVTKQNSGGSVSSPSRQVTFGSYGITEEPEPLSAGGLSHQSSQSRKRSYHLSDSLRHLAQVASAAMRRDSAISTDSVRTRGTIGSPTMLQRPDVLMHTQTAPPILEPDLIDTEAPGLAYDYYHPSLHDHPHGPEHSASYGPPLTIPDRFVEPSILPSSFISPTNDASVTPITPTSPLHGSPEGYGTRSGSIHRAEQATEPEPVDLRIESGDGNDRAPRPLQRTGTQPLQSFVSDLLPSPPLPSTEQLLVDPRSVMKATTRSELDYNAKQKLAGLTVPSPVGSGAVAKTSPNHSQHTPDLTPEPDREAFQEQEVQSVTYTELPWSSAPDININDLDANMANDYHSYADADVVMEASGNWEHPPSDTASPPEQTYHTPYSMPTSDVRSIPPSQPATPHIGGLSPGFSADNSAQGHDRRISGHTNTSSERTSQSPGNFACHECDRVFDQLHKLQ